jgi:hypothetical protein
MRSKGGVECLNTITCAAACPVSVVAAPPIPSQGVAARNLFLLPRKIPADLFDGEVALLPWTAVGGAIEGDRRVDTLVTRCRAHPET